MCTGARLHVVRVLVSRGVSNVPSWQMSCRNKSSYVSFPLRVSAHGALICQNERTLFHKCHMCIVPSLMEDPRHSTKFSKYNLIKN